MKKEIRVVPLLDAIIDELRRGTWNADDERMSILKDVADCIEKGIATYLKEKDGVV